MKLPALLALQRRGSGSEERLVGGVRARAGTLGCGGGLGSRGTRDCAQRRRRCCQEPVSRVVGWPSRTLDGARAELAATGREEVGRRAGRQKDGETDDEASVDPAPALCPDAAKHAKLLRCCRSRRTRHEQPTTDSTGAADDQEPARAVKRGRRLRPRWGGNVCKVAGRCPCRCPIRVRHNHVAAQRKGIAPAVLRATVRRSPYRPLCWVALTRKPGTNVDHRASNAMRHSARLPLQSQPWAWKKPARSRMSRE
jgi:hypothetical protein